MISIDEFCEHHNACHDGRDWAMANCKTMAHVWSSARPDWLVWVATRPGVLDDRTLRLFAVYCARSVGHLLTDQRSLRVIDVAERFAHGDATPEELQAARDAAWAASSAASFAASSAASYDASSAASYAASYAAIYAARAASSAARAASSAASFAALERQALWLRQHCTPNFSMGDE